MQTQKITFTLLVMFLVVSSVTLATAADFEWTRSLNTAAAADPTGYRTRLADRFNVGEATISDVLHVAQNPADAYMLFRLGEMSSKPTDYVIQKYNAEKDKGWGALAKSLGIKPGSPEFHALKNGNDLDESKGKNKGKSKSKNKGKGKNK